MAQCWIRHCVGPPPAVLKQTAGGTFIGEFYANCTVALAFAYRLRRAALGRGMLTWDLWDAGFLVLEVTFWAGARDALRKYYRRAEQLLAATQAAPLLESGDQP